MKTTSAGSNNGDRQRRRRVAAVLALAWGFAALPVACRRTDDGLRGQSGSEAPAGAGGTGAIPDEDLPCPCDALDVVLRVTVLDSSRSPAGNPAAAPASSRDAGSREAASEAPTLRSVRVEAVIHGETSLGAGAELRVEDYGQLPCLFGTATVADGQQALAVFTPADAPSCEGPECARVDGSVRLTPWANDLLFAQTADGSISVPVSELEGLWGGDVEACIERHGDVWRLLGLPAPDGER